MRSECGFVLDYASVSEGHACPMCSEPMRSDSDDYLLHKMNGLVRETRVGQIEMGRAVEDAVMNKKYLFCEAPVGTGKTLGYSIPAILNAVTREGLLIRKDEEGRTTTEGGRIVIATATKVLQNQISGVDLPLLHDKLDREFAYSLLKGKSNYACYHKVPDLEPADQAAVTKFLKNAPTGDVSEYPGGRPKFWGDVTAEDCIGASCRHALQQDCPYWEMKMRTKQANVVIANHALVAFDFRFGPRKMLGQYDVLIVDEVHKFQESLRGAWSQSIRSGTAQRLLRMSDRAGVASTKGKELDNAWKEMFKKVSHLEGEVAADPFGQSGTDSIAQLMMMHDAAIAGGDGYLQKTPLGNVAMTQPKPGYPEDDARTLMRLFILCRNIERVVRALFHAKVPTKNEFVHVVTEKRGKQQFKRVDVTPIDVGALAGARLYQIPTVIFTSATMAIGGKFGGIQSDLGAFWHPKLATAESPVDAAAAEAEGNEEGGEKPPPDEEDVGQKIIEPGGPINEKGQRLMAELIVDSPFNYATQAALYLPKHLPMAVDRESPDRAVYVGSLAMEINKLLQSSQGNAFVLFTSIADLEDVYNEVLNLGYPLPMVRQEDDVEHTIRQFKATPNCTVFGLKSFWEGVSIEGDKLHLVIITKLPFPNPRDAVLKARARRLEEELRAAGVPEHEIGINTFKALSVPQMLTELRQGAGRLIRTKTDLGILAILDPRMWTGSAKYKPKDYLKRPAGEHYGAKAVDAIGYQQITADYMIVHGLLQKFILLEKRRVEALAAKTARDAQPEGVSELPDLSPRAAEGE